MESRAGFVLVLAIARGQPLMLARHYAFHCAHLLVMLMRWASDMLSAWCFPIAALHCNAPLGFYDGSRAFHAFVCDAWEAACALHWGPGGLSHKFAKRCCAVEVVFICWSGGVSRHWSFSSLLLLQQSRCDCINVFCNLVANFLAGVLAACQQDSQRWSSPGFCSGPLAR